MKFAHFYFSWIFQVTHSLLKLCDRQPRVYHCLLPCAEKKTGCSNNSMCHQRLEGHHIHICLKTDPKWKKLYIFLAFLSPLPSNNVVLIISWNALLNFKINPLLFWVKNCKINPLLFWVENWSYYDLRLRELNIRRLPVQHSDLW